MSIYGSLCLSARLARLSLPAKPSPTTRNGKVHPVEGYTIETWNGSAWGAPVEYPGSSYTYTVGTDPAKVHFTWKWQPDGTKIILR